MGGTVLVLGASGLFGSSVAQAFSVAGWTVRRFKRGTDMVAASIGADVIVNGLNPPNYHDWARQIPAITAEVIAAGLASGATVIIPGNVYVYGDQPGPWSPATPHRPVARKGQIRATMEASYRAATLRGLRVILLRGGDFIAPDAAATVMQRVVLKDLDRGIVTSLGAPDVPRAYAYLPDMAAVAVLLAERRSDLPAYADVPFAGLTATATEMRDTLERLTGRRLRVARFPWWQLALLAPFWELARELREMRYLYETPHRLDPGPLSRLLPDVCLSDLDTVMASQIHEPSVVQGISMSIQTGN